MEIVKLVDEKFKLVSRPTYPSWFLWDRILVAWLLSSLKEIEEAIIVDVHVTFTSVQLHSITLKIVEYCQSNFKTFATIMKANWIRLLKIARNPFNLFNQTSLRNNAECLKTRWKQNEKTWISFGKFSQFSLIMLGNSRLSEDIRWRWSFVNTKNCKIIGFYWLFDKRNYQCDSIWQRWIEKERWDAMNSKRWVAPSRFKFWTQKIFCKQNKKLCSVFSVYRVWSCPTKRKITCQILS